jgi:hypothetical protein
MDSLGAKAPFTLQRVRGPESTSQVLPLSLDQRRTYGWSKRSGRSG